MTTGTLTYPGIIANNGGTGAFAKLGAGQLTLNTATNTYSGGTSITGGILSIDLDARLGAVPGTATPGNITLNGGSLQATAIGVTINSNRGIALGNSGGTISYTAGSGNLTYNGIVANIAGQTGSLQIIVTNSSGVYMPGGASTYSGSTTLGGSGTIVPTLSSTGPAGAPTSGPLGTGTLILFGGQLRSTTSADTTIGNNITFAVNTTIPTAVSDKVLTLSGAVTISGASRTLTTNSSADVVINGAIGDGGSALGLTKAGTGRFILGGNNTFSGGLAISQGDVRLNHAGALNSTTPNAVSFSSNANLKTLSLNGNSVTVASLSTGATVGTTTVRNSHFTTAATLTVNEDGLNTFGGILANGGSAKLHLIKDGAGELVLTGANTYTGNTTVAETILTVGASGVIPDASPVDIKAGATLQINSTLSETIGTLALRPPPVVWVRGSSWTAH